MHRNSLPRLEYLVSLNSHKIKKLWNHSQLKKQENLAEAASNKTDLFNVIDTELKMEIVIKDEYEGIKSGCKQ